MNGENGTFREESIRRGIPRTVPEGLTKEDWNEYRKKMIGLFSKEEYGVTPKAPEEVRAEETVTEKDWASKAQHKVVKLSFPTPCGEYSFSFDLTLPFAGRPLPLFVSLAFFPYPGGMYCPMEEIIDHGYAVASIHYREVTEDADDGFASGIAKMYPRRNDGTDWGKIGMWAFAASRVMDYVQTLPEIDRDRVYVIGHSRLGKTAIWCGVQDERFAGVVSNASGCSGAALARWTSGERIDQITDVFPYWFCENYRKYAHNEAAMPFDQHQLLALVAPRLLCVGSGSLDAWADPESEFHSAYLASDAYALLGKKGLMCGLETGNESRADAFDGRLGYHRRYGAHFQSRDDWRAYMEFFDRHSAADEAAED